jgi:dTDP-glucose pyrophosphorylase/DNA-binding XRE family transcriptional regulator
MDDNKIGKAISYLRKRAGYTQKDLADRIGISDKAVSKWERGLGLPDIGYLRKLSILLDTDTDSLLAGDVVHHDSSWSGIIVLDSNPYNIGAETLIYDKPLINYLLSYFLLVGIRSITVIGTEEDKRYINETLGDGKEYGIHLTTVTAGLKEVDIKQGNIMMVYGRCLLYGVDQTRFFQKAMINRDRFTMLVLPKKITHTTSHVVIDQNKRVINSNADEPLKTQYDFSDIPILFFPSTLLKAISASSSVTTFISDYASENEVYVQMLDRGFVEIEVDDWNNIQEASTFFRIVQDKCGMNVYCLEEVAWRRGFISLDQLKMHGKRYEGTEYGNYILGLYNRFKESIRQQPDENN